VRELTNEKFQEGIVKALAGLFIAGLVWICVESSVAGAQTMRAEAVEHPRIAAAIHELEGAITYMEQAPHDFGGHKLAAISASRAALQELRAALAFRARSDR
jgi:hypothetical protein